MKINFYDTSAILSNGFTLEGKNYVSALVLAELENIKTSSSKDDKLKYNARRAVRELMDTSKFSTEFFSRAKIEKLLKEFDFLSDINDHHLLCEAILLKRKYKDSDVYFITSDMSLYLFACEFEELYPIYLPEEKHLTDNLDNWIGWNKYYPGQEGINNLYLNKKINHLNAKTNEYCAIHEGQDLKDILRWDGEEYQSLHYKDFKSQLGVKIQPRNTEQKMLFDLLQNRDIPVKLCLGRFGSGKSYLMLAHALWLIQKGEFDKIVFVKNNIEVKDTGKLGALPGEELDKLGPFIQQIADHVGEFELEEMLNQNIIEPVHLGFIRGRDIRNSIIICDECENMTRQHMQLLLGRVSSRSEIWFIGDQKQCDSLTFEKNSGVQALIEGLAGDPLFGMVKLMKSERSKIAALADRLD